MLGAETRAARTVTLLTAAIVTLGIVLRCRGHIFSVFPLWLDEADWAIRLLEQPLREQLIRPIGFMAIAKATAYVFGPSERVLRFLPWVGGIVTTLLSPLLAKRLFRSPAARLLFVGVISLDPAAIDLSKEFKPYSFGLTIHAAMVYFALRYWQTKAVRDLACTLAIACSAVFFAQDAIFAFPGLFLLLGADALRGRRIRHFVATAIAAVLTLSVIGTLYALMWSRMDSSDNEQYYAKKYDVFYAPSGTETKTDWLAVHYARLAELPGQRRELWAPDHDGKQKFLELASVDALTWLFLHLAGMGYLIRRKHLPGIALLMSPLAVMLLFNVLGFWPFGPYRTNLFALLHVTGIACFAFERESSDARWTDLIATSALVILPFLALERTWHAQKEASVTNPSHLPEAVERLVSAQGDAFNGPKETLINDTFTCRPWRYYTKYHPTAKAAGRDLRRRFQVECRRDMKTIMKLARQRLRNSKSRVWILLSNPVVIEDLEHSWPSDLEKFVLQRINRDTHVIVGVSQKEG